MKSAGIMVVEDDQAIAEGLVRALHSQGWAARQVGLGQQALASADARLALVLLDLGLPDMDGLDVCRALRAAIPTLAIVILTARDTEIDIVAGLDAGADDYLVKPVRLSELLARVRAHLRRVGTAPSDPGPELLIAGPLRIDLAARRVWRDGQEVALRPKELDLLVVLVAQSGRVVTRERIMREVWEVDWFGSTKTLDTHMLTLRTKLGAPLVITTLRGVGYRLDVTG